MQILFIKRFKYNFPLGWETIINIIPRRTLKLPFFSTAKPSHQFHIKVEKNNNKK